MNVDYIHVVDRAPNESPADATRIQCKNIHEARTLQEILSRIEKRHDGNIAACCDGEIETPWHEGDETPELME